MKALVYRGGESLRPRVLSHPQTLNVNPRAGGIGKDGQLPWRLAGDMAYFKRITLDIGDAPDAATPR